MSMADPLGPNPLWGARSLDRARRWLERIRPLVEGARATKVPDAVRLDIEDFVAAMLGEATEVLEKGKSQLIETYQQHGELRGRAKERAATFVDEWLRSRPRSIMPGMVAVRHLDVHFEARYSGRMIQIQPPGSDPAVKVWWTHPAIPKAQHDLLYPSSRLSDDDLAAFNQYVKDTDLLDVLAEMLAEVTVFQDALANALR